MKSAGKARSNGLYRHIRTSKEIIRNLLNDYFEHNSTIFSEMLGEDEEYLRLKKAKRAAEEALQSVISKEAWNQYLALDEICNELECARYKAMYLAGAADYEKISK